MNDKTKQKNTEEVKQVTEVIEAIKKVAEKKAYKLSDEVKAYGKNCKIVEVLAEGRYHCKNLESPFDSFVVLAEEFE